MAFSPVWSSLANAPPPPSLSEGATLCEIQALLVSCQASLSSQVADNAAQNLAQARIATAEVLKVLPNITLVQQKTANLLDGQHASFGPGRPAIPSGKRSLPRSTSMMAGGSAKSAFLSPAGVAGAGDSDISPLPVVKRAFSRWYQEGWLSALQDLAENSGSNAKHTSEPYWRKMVATAANILLSLYSVTSSLHGSLHPSLRISGEDLIERYTNTRNWNTSPVKCLAWHPHTSKIAVALVDDSIQVNVPIGNNTPGEGVLPVLKYKQQ